MGPCDRVLAGPWEGSWGRGRALDAAGSVLPKISVLFFSLVFFFLFSELFFARLP